MPHYVCPRDVQSVQHQLDIVRKVDPGVAAFRLVGPAMPAQVDDDEPELPGKIGNQRYPVARIVGVPVDQDDGRTLWIAHVDVGEVLVVWQQHHLLQGVEFVEIDLEGWRSGSEAIGTQQESQCCHWPADTQRGPPSVGPSHGSKFRHWSSPSLKMGRRTCSELAVRTLRSVFQNSRQPGSNSSPQCASKPAHTALQVLDHVLVLHPQDLARQHFVPVLHQLDIGSVIAADVFQAVGEFLAVGKPAV